MKVPDRATIGIVVPSLFDTGGVISVAAFLQRIIRQDRTFDARFFSLATSARDSSSILLRRPTTWIRGVDTKVGDFNGDPFIHVGASLAEFEFRRYAPRRELHRLLADCDLVQVVAGAPAWVLPVVGCGKPIILQVATLAKVERRMSDYLPRNLLSFWRRIMTQITARYDETGLRAADAVMVENPWMLDYARTATAGLDTIVRYAPPGVDVDQFRPAANHELERAGYILAVGRFSDPRKNSALLLDAFARVSRLASQPLRLVIAGPNDPGEVFRARVKAAGLEDKVIVHVMPSDDVLAELYRNATCFALSSHEEGLGIVVLEAMASGIPVVATRCGGPEGIITDGVDGFLVPTSDPAAMADRLATLVGNPAINREIGAKARQTITTRFSRDVTGKTFLDVYHKLLSAKKLRTCS